MLVQLLEILHFVVTNDLKTLLEECATALY
jgi:hypothetical protein